MKLIFLFFCVPFFSFGQNIPDSLYLMCVDDYISKRKDVLFKIGINNIDIYQVHEHYYQLPDTIIGGIRVKNYDSRNLYKKTKRRKTICVFYFQQFSKDDRVSLRLTHGCISRKKKHYKITIQGYILYEIVYNEEADRYSIKLSHIYD
jgi:hypothetical protein